jgi:uncharacterized protein (DUF488 family)
VAYDLNVAARDTLTFTVGYAGRTLAEFVSVLQGARVDRVVDVRALPLSRRKGFSKTALSDALAKQGIEYVHLRAAGNPYRDRKNDINKCLALYAGHLDDHPSVVSEVGAAVEGRRAALLCVEADACHCHRSIIAERLQRLHPQREVRDL